LGFVQRAGSQPIENSPRRKSCAGALTHILAIYGLPWADWIDVTCDCPGNPGAIAAPGWQALPIEVCRLKTGQPSGVPIPGGGG